MAKQITLDEVQNYLKAQDIADAWTVYTGTGDKQEESVIRDMVSKVFRFKSLSDKQVSYTKSLLKRIADRPAREAAQKAQWEAAQELPVGRLTFKATVLAVKDTDFGLKLLLQHEDGWKVYGSCPRGVYKPQKGDTVEMTATLKKSEKDAKFGFYSRPMKASIVGRKDVFEISYTTLHGTSHTEKLATAHDAKNYFDWAISHENMESVLFHHNGNVVDSWGT